MVIDIPTKPHKVPDLKQRDVRATGGAFTNLTHPLDMNANVIREVANPTAAQDAATKNWCEGVQSISNIRNLGVQNLDLRMGGENITGLATPVANDDAATKLYADGVTGYPAGTAYFSAPGAAFHQDASAVDQFQHSTANGNLVNDGGDADVFLQVNFPTARGGTITHVIVYGSDITDSWEMFREELDGSDAGTSIATAAINTFDTTFTGGRDIIDTSFYKYWIKVNLSAGENIRGMKIIFSV